MHPRWWFSHFCLQKCHYCISFLLLLRQIVTDLVGLINTSSQVRSLAWVPHGYNQGVSRAACIPFQSVQGESLPVHLSCWQNQFLAVVKLRSSFSGCKQRGVPGF